MGQSNQHLTIHLNKDELKLVKRVADVLKMPMKEFASQVIRKELARILKNAEARALEEREHAATGGIVHGNIAGTNQESSAQEVSSVSSAE